ncbi:deleted in oral cancer 1/cdk2-associated protein-like [Schistosoma mansoni]|nr:deleted in oral cancer 1/cdk2-associated protein-like [Schistosoma mansoni]|eukprot:XP_018650835.1 deleted in oral cancer 1/cdk2-associated protein-like [Schistosoma mansoni]
MNEDTGIFLISGIAHEKWELMLSTYILYYSADSMLVRRKERMTQNTSIPVNYPMMPPMDDLNKYAHLLQVIEEMGRDIKPTYANNKNAAERLKKNIHTARILVRECVSELERVMKA